MAETDNTSNTSIPAPAPLTEGYQAIKGYQSTHLERGYQATVAVTPSQPPQGGSVIAAPGQVTGTSPQGTVTPPPAITPPQGGSVIAPSPPVAEQK